MGIAEIIFGLCMAVTGVGTVYYSMMDEDEPERLEKEKNQKPFHHISFLSFLHGIMHEQVQTKKRIPGSFGYTDYYINDPYLCAVSMYPNFIHIRLSCFREEEEKEIATYYIKRTNGEKYERMELHLAEFVTYQHEMKHFFHFFARQITQLPEKEPTFTLLFSTSKEPIDIVETVKALFPDETWLTEFLTKIEFLQKEKEHLPIEAKYQVEEHLYQDIQKLIESYQKMNADQQTHYKKEIKTMMAHMNKKLTHYVEIIERKKEHEFLRQQERMKQRWKDE